MYAIDTIRLQAEHWFLDSTNAKQFDLSVALTDEGLQLSVFAEKLELPLPLVGYISNLQLTCDNFQVNTLQWQCESGTAAFTHQLLGEQHLRFGIKAHRGKRSYQIIINDLKLDESQLNLQAEYIDSAWSVSLSVDNLAMTTITNGLAMLVSESNQPLLLDWESQGRLKIDGRLTGNARHLEVFELDWQATEMSFSNTNGSQVAENLLLRGRASGRLQNSDWHWYLKLLSDAGQAYSEPIFFDLNQFPISLEASGLVSTDFSMLKVNQLQFDQEQVLTAEATLNWQKDGLQSLHIATGSAELSQLYPLWLQPFIAGTAAAKLETSGRLAINFDWQQSGYQFQLDFKEAMLNDKEGRYALQNLNGQMGWSQSSQILNTSIAWTSAKLFGIDLGAAAIDARSAENSLILNEPLRLPVLDGLLEINDFSLEHYTEKLRWQFDGLLMPISMQRLTEALAWPSLKGKLSGVIPTVTYQDEELKINGALQVNVFDGTAVIRDLKMTSPFGRLPQLYANVDIRSLDLALLTNAFDFGFISGRVEGYVHNLRLSNWEPVHFDAKLATSEQAPGKRRISQKAIDNLTELGGGTSGMVSRGFLGMFDEFSYQRLGLSCKLRNEVCEMTGVEEIEQGYYIVKGWGGFPPWINVIGYNHRVDWSELISRLLSVRESPDLLIE